MEPGISKGRLCALFGKTRQGWYDEKYRKRDRHAEELFILTQVLKHRKIHKRMGTIKLRSLINKLLIEHDIKIGRDRFYELLRKHQLLIKPHRRRTRTTDSDHPYIKYPNIAKELALEKSGQLWVSDITYLRLRNRFAYLSLVTDAYSRKVVGWALWPTLNSQGPLTALQMAIQHQQDCHALIHHSDRGIQYCCNDYVHELQQNGIKISMTERGDPYENALAERMNETFKVEYELEQTFDSFNQAKQETQLAIEAYNSLRPHMSLGLLTPDQAHQMQGNQHRMWKKDRYKKRNQSSVMQS